MSPLAEDLWARAKDALKASRHVLPISPDTAASRAYYAAFYAVSAHFALDGRTFRKHSAVEAAVHRDLVRSGLWPEASGEDYAQLLRLRNTGDCGGPQHVSADEAAKAVQAAGRIMWAVATEDPDAFGGIDESLSGTDQ